MKKIIMLILCFFTSIAFASVTPAMQLASQLNSFKTLSANFSEITTDASQQILQKSAGVMMISKPNYFRFETQSPTHQIIITNGKTLWVYDVDLMQATKQKIQNMPANPAKILSGNVSVLLKQFSVRLLSNKNNETFQLMPKKPEQFRSVTIVFDHGVLKSMQVQSNLGQASVFTFTNVKRNPSLPSTLFHFHAPTGVDILT